MFVSDNWGRVWKRLWDLLKHGWQAGFVYYVSFLLVSAVFSRKLTDPLKLVWAHFGFREDEAWNCEIIENVLFFIPVGLLFLKAFRPEKPFLAALAASAAVSGLIELTQLVLRLGSFQVSDLLHNILGGAVGYGVWLIARRCRRERKS